MSGVLFMLTKDNVTIGIEWRFGPDWPGQRCGAKTRRGTACQRPANKKNGRCRLHGGASTGAKTDEGRVRISAANLRHGKFTKRVFSAFMWMIGRKACFQYVIARLLTKSTAACQSFEVTRLNLAHTQTKTFHNAFAHPLAARGPRQDHPQA